MNPFNEVWLVFASAVPWLIVGILATAGVSKLKSENQSFYKATLQNYAFFPSPISGVLPRLIGSAEVAIALLCLISATRLFGLMCAAGLLFLYTVGLFIQLLEGKADMDCGCAGPGADIKIGMPLIVRNLVLVALSALAAMQLPIGATSWLLSLPVAAMLGLFYLSSEQLIGNAQKIQQLRATHWS